MPLPPCSVTWIKAMQSSAGGAIAVLSWRNIALPVSLNWLDEFDEPQLARQLYTELFRWWISPSYLTMRSCNIGYSSAGTDSKAYSRPRFNRHGDRITTLLVRGFTNDSQLQTRLIICCNAAIPPVSPVLLRRCRTFTTTKGEINDYC